MFTRTTTLVEENTAIPINVHIRRDIDRRVREYGRQGEKAVRQRLEELDWEWDMERMLEANAAGITLLGILLGRTVNRAFLVIPAIVAIFLMQHAVQGWCPPLPLLRRMGVRTSREIELERTMLRALVSQRH